MQEEGPRKAHKVAKKHSNLCKEPAGEDFKQSTLMRKQTEVARVLQLKCNMLLQGNLSYLEYIELREELCRLNALKDQFIRLVANFEKR